MRFRCRSTKNVYDGNYHRFFVLWPISLDDGICIWLETVQRKYTEVDPGCWAGGGKWTWTFVEFSSLRHIGVLTCYPDCGF